MKIKIAISLFIFIIISENIMSLDLKNALGGFKSSLPPSWTYEITKDSLKFRSTEEIYILHENKINAPMQIYEKSQDNAERIKKYGKKTNAFIIYKVISYTNIQSILKLKSKQAFYNDNKILVFDSEAGVEDEFNSVFPYNAYEQIYKIRNLMKENFISILFDSSMELSDYIDKKVMIIGNISNIPWQHMMAGDDIYRYSEYFDIDKTQIVAYFKAPVKN